VRLALRPLATVVQTFPKALAETVGMIKALHGDE